MHTNTTTRTPSTLPLAPGRWELDTNHSRVGFSIRHLGVSKVRGIFKQFTAEVEIGATAADSTLEVVVDVASLDTGNSDRDAHVLSDELLDLARRPTLTFRGRDLTGDGEDWFLSGELTIGEVTRPLDLHLEFGGIEAFPVDGRGHAGFEARGEIRRKDFGLDTGLLAGALLGEVVKLELDVQLLEPLDPSAG